MKCPGCGTFTLEVEVLDEGLKTRSCRGCQGRWISSKDYWAWLNHQNERLPECEAPDTPLDILDSPDAMICAECGHIMFKYHVGHGMNFRIDHCDACNGVWLDQNEWEALRSRNLHDEIHLISSGPWQSELYSEERAQALEQIHKKKFGDDFDKLKEIKSWLNEHPERSSILAFLSAS